MRPSISVCIATFNGERYIREQIASILPQLGTEDEIVISDDGSKDDTLKIVKQFHDSRIKIVVNEGEHGYTPNFENALMHSSKYIIFLSDQDDVWEHDKIAKCIESLKDCDFIVHNAMIIDCNGQEIHSSYFEKRGVYGSLLLNFIKFGYLGCCMVFKREILKKAIPFPSNHYLCTHDNWLFLIAKSFFKVKILNQCLIKYRRHGDNASSGGNKRDINLWFMIKYRIYLLINIFKRHK